MRQTDLEANFGSSLTCPEPGGLKEEQLDCLATCYWEVKTAYEKSIARAKRKNIQGAPLQVLKHERRRLDIMYIWITTELPPKTDPKSSEFSDPNID